MKTRLTYLFAITLLLLIVAGGAMAQQIDRQIPATTGAGGLNLSKIQIDYTVGEPVVKPLDSIGGVKLPFGLTQGFLQPPLGPRENGLKVDLKLYPNPAWDITTIDFNLDVNTKVVDVRVTNLLGQVVLVDKVESPPIRPAIPPITYWKMMYTINVSKLVPGPYVMSIKTDKGLSVTKMFIKVDMN